MSMSLIHTSDIYRLTKILAAFFEITLSTSLANSNVIGIGGKSRFVKRIDDNHIVLEIKDGKRNLSDILLVQDQEYQSTGLCSRRFLFFVDNIFKVSKETEGFGASTNITILKLNGCEINATPTTNVSIRVCLVKCFDGLEFFLVENNSIIEYSVATIYVEWLKQEKSSKTAKADGNPKTNQEQYTTPLVIATPMKDAVPMKTDENESKKSPREILSNKKEKLTTDKNNLNSNLQSGTIIPNILPFLYNNESKQLSSADNMIPANSLLITANTSEPIPFSNEFFEGKCLLMIQPSSSSNSASNLSPKYQKKFAEVKDHFEVQVQGKFKSTDLNDMHMFVGAEITKKMELGLFTKGLCSSILQFCKNINPHLHHSFGDDNNYELPHLTTPFWNTVDKLVITKPGETPPPFLEPFPETAEARKHRKKIPDYRVEIDLDCIYSFSIQTCHLDVERWKAVNLPLMKTLSLQTFWADADIRFIAYFMEKNPNKAANNSIGLPKFHLVSDQKRFFVLEVQNSVNHPEWQQVGRLQDFYRNALTQSEPVQESNDDSYHIAERVLAGEEDATEEQEDIGSDFEAAQGITLSSSSKGSSSNDEQDFIDARDGYDIDPIFQATLTDLRNWRSTIQSQMTNNTNNNNNSNNDLKSEQKTSEEAVERSSTLNQIPKLDGSARTLSKISASILQRSNNALVIAAVEVEDTRATLQKKRRTLFVFYLPEQGYSVLKSYNEWKHANLPLLQISAKTEKWQRLQQNEKHRLRLEVSYRMILQSGTADMLMKLRVFLNSGDDGNAFLSQYHIGRRASRKLRPQQVLDMQSTVESSASQATETGNDVAACISLQTNVESPIAIRLSNRFWSQEYMLMTATEIIITKPSTLRGSSIRVKLPLASILAVHAINDILSNDHDTQQISSVSHSSNTQNISHAPSTSGPLYLQHASYLVVSTFSRQYMIMVKNKELRNSWVTAIQTRIQSCKLLRRQLTMSNVVRGGDDEMNILDLLTPSVDWNLGEKVILNARNFTVGGGEYLLRMRDTQREALAEVAEDPVKLLERLLALAFQLSSQKKFEELAASLPNVLISSQSMSVHSNSASISVKTSEEHPNALMSTFSNGTGNNHAVTSAHWLIWMEFMDGLSLLQNLSLEDFRLTAQESLALFLNLYHCMLIHACLVAGLPTSLMKWQALFRNYYYEAFGDVFNLAELEHCVIRYGMNRPNITIFAQALLPSTRFTFSQDMRDIRLLWAVNSASEANIPNMPIFQQSKLNSQLDAVIRLSLEKQVTFTPSAHGKSGGVLTLPIICQWHAKDFEAHYASMNANSLESTSFLSTWSTTKPILASIVDYLVEGSTAESVVRSMLESNSTNNVTIKYSAFDFGCRLLSQLE